MSDPGPVFAHHGDRLLYKVDEAAAVLAVSRCRVYDLIMSGELPSVKIGGTRRRITRAALEEYVTRLAKEAAGPAPDPAAITPRKGTPA
jgi:excisionase family DNA binding protein